MLTPALLILICIIMIDVIDMLPPFGPLPFIVSLHYKFAEISELATF
jgi:hypothetical protein